MKLAFISGYVIWLIVCAGMIYYSRQPAQPPSFVAERDPVANRLLEPGDLKSVPTDDAQYMKHAVKKGQKIQSDGTSSFPTLTSKLGKLPVAFSVDWAEARTGAINAGISVRVCQAGKTILEPAEVQAVICPVVNASCIALADIPADKASALTGAFQASPPVNLQEMSSKCEVRTPWSSTGPS